MRGVGITELHHGYISHTNISGLNVNCLIIGNDFLGDLIITSGYSCNPSTLLRPLLIFQKDCFLRLLRYIFPMISASLGQGLSLVLLLSVLATSIGTYHWHRYSVHYV